jgi:hypothetical protein
VNAARCVDGAEPTGDTQGDTGGERWIYRSLGDAFGQRRPLDELEHKKPKAVVLHNGELPQLHDVGCPAALVDALEELELPALEASVADGAGGALGAEHFERYWSRWIRALIHRADNPGKPTFSKGILDQEAPGKQLPGNERAIRILCGTIRRAGEQV